MGEGRSNAGPIEFKDSPLCQRSHISAFCSAVYFIRVLYVIILPLFLRYKIKCCLDQLNSPDRRDIDDRANNYPERLTFRLLKYMFQFDQRVRQQIEQFGRKYPDVISHEIKSDMDLANIGPKFFEAIPQSI